MPKPKTHFVCQECGGVSRKWAGKCDQCHAWNTLVEEEIVANIGGNDQPSAAPRSFVSLDSHTEEPPRVQTTMEELDRVLGGGLVQGSAVLIGGDPGIGKSTLLLQVASAISSSGLSVAYISGEESIEQIQLRARRLGVETAPLKLLAASNMEEITSTLTHESDVSLVILDSIQTLYTHQFSSAPGTVSQVRAAAQQAIQLAKERGIILLIVGHVTKDGQLAGPKVLEHMVDTVLYFEGERGHQFRILRSIKNRFGGVNEIGVFSMNDRGLQEVFNPSSLFLPPTAYHASGSAIFAGVEGTRPVLVEIQALVAPSQMPAPRRAVVGWDQNRLAMILAILSTRYGIQFGDKEVYLNVAGGLRIVEPAADLAAAAALVSAALNRPLPRSCIIFGELGLSGEVRPVSQSDARLKEAMKLGFAEAITPPDLPFQSSDITTHELHHIKSLSDIFKVSHEEFEGA